MKLWLNIVNIHWLVLAFPLSYVRLERPVGSMKVLSEISRQFVSFFLVLPFRQDESMTETEGHENEHPVEQEPPYLVRRGQKRGPKCLTHEALSSQIPPIEGPW